VEKHNDGQHRSPSYEPDGRDTGQRTMWRDRRNRTAVSNEQAAKYPTRLEIEREQQERMR
jgi:hypothetical protein